MPELKNFVFRPMEERSVSMNKTKACKSMNHILKLSWHWKTFKFPELVEKLHQVVWSCPSRTKQLRVNNNKITVGDTLWKTKSETMWETLPEIYKLRDSIMIICTKIHLLHKSLDRKRARNEKTSSTGQSH